MNFTCFYMTENLFHNLHEKNSLLIILHEIYMCITCFTWTLHDIHMSFSNIGGEICFHQNWRLVLFSFWEHSQPVQCSRENSLWAIHLDGCCLYPVSGEESTWDARGGTANYSGNAVRNTESVPAPPYWSSLQPGPSWQASLGQQCSLYMRFLAPALRACALALARPVAVPPPIAHERHVIVVKSCNLACNIM